MGNDTMDFGKKITTESFFGGRVKSTKTIFSVPTLVNDKTQAFNEVMRCLELVAKDKPNTMTIRIDLDPKSKQFRMITREYEI